MATPAKVAKLETTPTGPLTLKIVFTDVLTQRIFETQTQVQPRPGSDTLSNR